MKKIRKGSKETNAFPYDVVYRAKSQKKKRKFKYILLSKKILCFLIQIKKKESENSTYQIVNMKSLSSNDPNFYKGPTRAVL